MSLAFSGLGAQLVSTSAPLLPWPDGAQAYLVLGWATVLAAAVGVLLRRQSRAIRGWACAGMVAWAVWPGPWSPVYWMGLAFQAPSLVSVGWCGLVLYAALRPAPIPWTPEPFQRRALGWLALAAVAWGWILLLDTFAVWPLSLYTLGFSPAAVGVVAVCASLPWCLGGGRLGAISWTLYGVLLLQILTRWPDGNLWNALLDPWLWLGLQVWGLTHWMRRRRTA